MMATTTVMREINNAREKTKSWSDAKIKYANKVGAKVPSSASSKRASEDEKRD